MERTFLHDREYRGDVAMQKIGELHVTLCGIGAIGSNLANDLVRQGVKNLKAIDADRVEQHNIGNQLYRMPDIGGWKTEALRNHLFDTCEVEIEIANKRMDSSNARKLIRETDVVVDAFDNSESRRVVQEYCRQTETPCLHVGLSTDYGEVVWEPNYEVPGDVEGDVCEYPLARNLVSLTVSVAAEQLIRFAVGEETEDYSITLRDFAVRLMAAPLP